MNQSKLPNVIQLRTDEEYRSDWTRMSVSRREIIRVVERIMSIHDGMDVRLTAHVRRAASNRALIRAYRFAWYLRNWTYTLLDQEQDYREMLRAISTDIAEYELHTRTEAE